ncbi:hypothetical protein MGG_17990 [Pyricularia oryzae 70-15]|uniref:Uncharacterized protein n=3 Tax=Pyricularia oryzae TaxID=318829 RepID=G4NJA5_PYRO7|nr:uncharacterized protein MGG_17990 [Pyricularia oryzae 70-15]EHA46321.1 hypothetical protein MGG_17990 [Pyricularia oryzae 70-15]ELQ36230.1 hypothetical protein OOU_Y34scaffold00666g91 [Pyricularia oryzae Y34]
MVLARQRWNADPLKPSVFASATRFTLLAARTSGTKTKEKNAVDATFKPGNRRPIGNCSFVKISSLGSMRRGLAKQGTKGAGRCVPQPRCSLSGLG